jgi:hypothetical protein
VNGLRYNARVLARHIAERRFGIAPERPELKRDDVVPYLLAEVARGPELLVQKGYLTRLITFDPANGIRDEGIVPLADFVDRSGPDACAVAVEYDAGGTVVPVVYVRRGGALSEHALPPHPMHAFDTDAHRTELEARIAPLLG